MLIEKEEHLAKMAAIITETNEMKRKLQEEIDSKDKQLQLEILKKQVVFL